MVTLSTPLSVVSSCLQYGQFGSENTAILRLPLPFTTFTAFSNGSFAKSILLVSARRASVRLVRVRVSTRSPSST